MRWYYVNVIQNCIQRYALCCQYLCLNCDLNDFNDGHGVNKDYFALCNIFVLPFLSEMYFLNSFFTCLVKNADNPVVKVISNQQIQGVIMLKKSLTAVAVCTSFFLLSCSGDSSTSPGNVNSTEVAQDLQKIANAVDNFAMLDKNNENNVMELTKSKASSQDTFYTLKPGVEVFQYSDSDFQYIDTTYTYAMDGVTLIDDYSSLESYKQCIKSFSSSSKSKSYVVFNSVIKSIPSTSDQVDPVFEMTMDGTGYIDYFNDSLLLSFSKISCKLDNESCSYDYRFSMFDGKYNVSLVGTIDMDEEMEIADTAVIASGTINLASTGERAGTFQMLYSDDVRILDNNGVIVKKTK